MSAAPRLSSLSPAMQRAIEALWAAERAAAARKVIPLPERQQTAKAA
jgi:hypothetical protein